MQHSERSERAPTGQGGSREKEPVGETWVLTWRHAAAVDKAEPVHFSENQEAGADGGREDSQRRSRPWEHLEGVAWATVSGLAGAACLACVRGSSPGTQGITLCGQQGPSGGWRTALAPAPL